MVQHIVCDFNPMPAPFIDWFQLKVILLSSRIFYSLACLFVFFFINSECIADEKDLQDTPSSSMVFDSLTLYWENDFFIGTDHDYTNGLKLTWGTSFGEMKTANLPAWSYQVLKILPFVNVSGGKRALSLSIGQDIYTPKDTGSVMLIKDDRPYAGYTYLAAGFHALKENRKDTWEIRLGIVGPAALAEDTQNAVHNLIRSDPAQGWDNQLNNEVTFDAIFESKWRLWSSKFNSNFGFDLIPHLGGSVGTVNVYLNAGAELRMGWELPSDFGSCPIRGGCEISSPFSKDRMQNSSFHLFFSTDGKVVVHDIFLDGNNFSDSHSVSKKPLVAELMCGIAWQLDRIKITYSLIFRSEQFDTQVAANHNYGSLSLLYSF